jgi:hypothetical protein
LAPDGIKYESIENSTFNSDSDTQNGEMVANYGKKKKIFSKILSPHTSEKLMQRSEKEKKNIQYLFEMFTFH